MSRTVSGCVRIRRSLLPRRSRSNARKRSPRKSCSVSRRAWISVPIAPSRIRMRRAARARRACETSAPSTGRIDRSDIVFLSLSPPSPFGAVESWMPGPNPGVAAAPLRSRPLGPGLRTQPQEVADRVDEIRAIHRVEVEFVYAGVDEVDDLLGRDRGSDEPSRVDVLVEPVEAG